ncbi:MAG: helix-turn-helix transcriptional regulator [Verrucomicrobiae bacterium]|nr:helix-turn-helix transcriptional regulator [Verrucomicrobiae bacterium]
MKYAKKSKVETQHKPLMESMKTIGDWIKAQREQRNLTSGHVALKMGIAHALVLSWETNASKPVSQQMQMLAKLFGAMSNSLQPTNHGG